MSRKKDTPQKYYTITEIEPIVGHTHRTIMQHIYDGKLQAVKIGGGKWKISEENLQRYLSGK